ncbi:MAG: FAD-binding protein [bacterium]|nr:FAD-binding protein [bacterium]
MGANALIQHLRDLGDGVLLQDEPYPVVAPQSIEQLQSCIAAARNEGSVVLPLGNGSSFPKDFSLLRERVLAVMTIRLQGTDYSSPFSVHVASGTPVSAVIADFAGGGRRTLGGLFADARMGTTDPLLRAVWSRTRAIDIITGDARLVTLAGPARCGAHDGTASWLIGSRGRLGVLVSVELVPPLPVHVMEDLSDEKVRGAAIGPVGESSVLSSGDIRSKLDPHGLFQW